MQVEKVLKYQGEKHTELFVTGHSLGAALSVLFGIRLAHKYPERNVQVINFGCPKVGVLACYAHYLGTSLVGLPSPLASMSSELCPKVGNAAFAHLVNSKENLCVQRVAHKSDVTTRIIL